MIELQDCLGRILQKNQLLPELQIAKHKPITGMVEEKGRFAAIAVGKQLIKKGSN